MSRYLGSLLLKRYSIPRGNLTTFAMGVAVLGVAIGIAQLMLVLSVMSGFEDMLKTNYTRITSDLVVFGEGVKEADIRKDKRVLATTESYFSQALLTGKASVAGVVLEGIDPKTSESVTNWHSVMQKGPVKVMGDWIWLGYACAEKLGVGVGEQVEITLFDGRKRKAVPVTVAGITKFGIYDHDKRYARIDNALFIRLFGARNPIYKLKLVARVDPEGVKPALQKRLGRSAHIRLWNELHRNQFLAVQHQKKLLFLVLQIVIALAGINVVNLLVMNTHFRNRDLAILRAMGMPRISVFKIFLTQGLLIGLCGVVGGVALGVVVCFVVEHFQPNILSEAVYNVTRLPIVIQPLDVVALSAAALFLCLVFSVFPAWRATRRSPMEALRNE
ncbi:MAG: ABC transporter permease [Deltaproteobacteria bacterium]|nr:ABC transporter permease [Deltaproteobacteria bacterium]MBI3296402.1 ABC transporter permease [Deltaproteobacteria bacterium]